MIAKETLTEQMAAVTKEAEREVKTAVSEAVSSKMRSFSLWSFLRDVLSQGTAIQQDWEHGNLNTYGAYSARMDAAAREREDQLERALQIHETALSLDTMTAERDRLRAEILDARRCGRPPECFWIETAGNAP